MHQRLVVQKMIYLFTVYILAAMVVFAGNMAEARQEVIIFHAGSLKIPLAEIEKRFEVCPAKRSYQPGEL